MKKNTRKCTVLAAVMSLCMLFTGCNNSGSSSSSTTSATESGTTSQATSATESSAASDTSSVVSTADSTAAGTDSTASDTTSSSEVTASDGFKVDGAKLLDAKGNEFILRGINHAHAWYKDQLETAIPAIAATGANCVRIVCSNGNVWTKTEQSEIEQMIKLCEDNKLVCILEVHDATTGTNENGKQATDDVSDLQKCADYWIEMKDVVNAHTDTVIVNIANEWHNAGWAKPDEWAKGYETVIPQMREAGIKNTIMVDADGGGQYTKCLYGDEEKGTPGYATEILAADPDKNTMFSIHMYEFDASTEQDVKTVIDNTIGTGVCFCIGEFANTRSAKKDNVADEAITAYCTEKNIGYIAWSWKGNTPEKISSKETLPFSVMDISEEWDGSKLSEAWGEKIINGENGIKQTSKICTVFE